MFKFRTARLLAGSAILLCASLPAFAHSHPVKMNPAPDTTVSAPPEISIFFSEDLEPKWSSLKLMDKAGKPVTTEPSTLDPANHKHLTLKLPSLTPGLYTVQWMSSSADGHRLSRSYTFTVK